MSNSLPVITEQMLRLYNQTQAVLVKIKTIRDTENPIKGDLKELAKLESRLLELCPKERFIWKDGVPITDKINKVVRLRKDNIMMKNNYHKIVTEIGSLEAKLADNVKRKAEAKERLAEVDRAIPKLQADLKKELLDGDPKKIKAIEKKLQDHRTKIRERDLLLIEGLEEEAVELNRKLSDAMGRKDHAFGKLGAAFLLQETGKYNSVAKALIREIKRLQACFHLLRESNQGPVFQEILGESYRVIPKMKIPLAGSEFNQADLSRGGQFTFGPDILNAVMEEIVGK